MTEHFSDSPADPNKVSPRHVFEVRIQLNFQRDQRKLSRPGWVRDLSESGLRAFVAEALLLDEAVILEIPLPDSNKQVIPAKVVRVLGTEYGFQFTALSAEQRCALQAVLNGRPVVPFTPSVAQTSA